MDKKRIHGKYSPYFVGIVALFVTTLIIANITAVKLIVVAGLIVPAAVVIFPVSYIAGDVLTEVYGYSRARQVIWLGFVCNFVAVGAVLLGQILPPAPFWNGQAAYERILGYTPRLLTASFLAYLIGEFFNAYVMAKLKILTAGRWLWTRTVSSTLIGQGLDSLVFISVAFAGTIPVKTLALIVLTQWLLKCAYEAAATPFTYWVVGFLKRREGMDVYDHHTRFNPLTLK
ncbi:MAG: queuosine precursor transporter [Thermodesulfobacteriota bacterium]